MFRITPSVYVLPNILSIANSWYLFKPNTIINCIPISNQNLYMFSITPSIHVLPNILSIANFYYLFKPNTIKNCIPILN